MLVTASRSGCRMDPEPMNWQIAILNVLGYYVLPFWC